jgi:hypothetical protein
MRIHNVYADEDGETHFRDIEIELSEAGPDETRQSDFLRPGLYFGPLHRMFFLFSSGIQCYITLK